MAYLSPQPRVGDLRICAGSATSVAAMQLCADDLSILERV